MKNKIIKISALCALFFQSSLSAESLSVQQILQRVVDHYPSIKSAAIQVERAKQEHIKVKSQLSWILNANAGYNKDTGFLGTTTDRYNVGGGFNRALSSGGSLGFNANISQEEATDSFSPVVPNPLTKTRFDVNYRHRFEKGAGNPFYTEGLKSADANEIIVFSEQLNFYDQLAAQVIELYLSALIVQSRIKNIDKTIKRTTRLKKYITEEFTLGLSEKKDVLQVDARLSVNQADKKGLQIIWKKQLIELNRLMGRNWDNEIIADMTINRLSDMLYQSIYTQSKQHSPGLKQVDARILIAESSIRRRRDNRKDELDLILFVGNEFNQGDVAQGDFDESALVGGIRLEFNRGLDKTGFDAELRQAQYDRGIALEDKKQILEDLQYEVAGLLAEIESSEIALLAFKKSMIAEKSKLDEAVERYKDGRIETDRIIDFESQLAAAEFSYDLQTIELIRRYYQIDLVRGIIWENIHFPQFSFDEYLRVTKQDNN